MRAMLRILLLAVLYAALHTAPARAVAIEFWTTEMAPERQAVIRYLAQAFMAQNPDIQVNITGVEENTIQFLGSALDEGVGPDIVSARSDIVVAIAEQGRVAKKCTGEMIRAIGEKRFFTGALATMRNKDGTYNGIPFSGWVQGIWYRADWFKEAGLDPPDTPERILKAAQTLCDSDKGRFGILVGTREDAYAEQVFTHLALAMGVREFDPDGKVVFAGKNAVRALTLYKELARYSPPGQQYWRARDYYMQGRLAMMFYSTFIMDDLALPTAAADSLTGNNFPDLDGAPFDPHLLRNTGMVSVITGTRPASYGVIHALGIPVCDDPERKRAIMRFISFLFRTDAYITWLHMAPGGMLPVLRDIAGADDFYRDAQGVFKRYTRTKIENIISGLGNIESFSFEEGRLIPKAAQASAEAIIPEMILRTLREGIPPRSPCNGLREGCANCSEITAPGQGFRP
ncbi:ABC transporter substrate-binding protein [Salidesulfovibrio onnuriiensis]|uniref:ABC transporter substrate-binding protein n=1 Tax=Salidesulfovibrio onnuriiensis TaxID=2583823 RepID=UPI0011C7BB23|nr:extracellular solute-binding protein [Salidesulfovibrio onnuriiensis]